MQGLASAICFIQLIGVGGIITIIFAIKNKNKSNTKYLKYTSIPIIIGFIGMFMSDSSNKQFVNYLDEWGAIWISILATLVSIFLSIRNQRKI